MTGDPELIATVKAKTALQQGVKILLQAHGLLPSPEHIIRVDTASIDTDAAECKLRYSIYEPGAFAIPDEEEDA